VPVRIVKKDQKYNELAKRLWGKEKVGVAVGLLASGPAAAQHESKNPQQRSSLTVIDVGIIHEFGLGVPERSFIRSWVDANRQRCLEAMRRLMLAVIKGKYERTQALNLFGLWVQGQIQAHISQGIPPPNAPSTIAAKGSATPLVDTGQLRAAITFALRQL